MLLENIWVGYALLNEATGTVRDIVWELVQILRKIYLWLYQSTSKLQGARTIS